MCVQVYKLYNTSRLDFNVFYCSNVAGELQKQLPADESKDLKLVRFPPPPRRPIDRCQCLKLALSFPGSAVSTRA